MKENNDKTNMDDIPKDVGEEIENDIELEEVGDDGEIESKAKTAKLKERIKELQKESKDNLDRWTRARADYINFKKEVDDKRRDEIKMASKSLIEKILPTLDSFDMAKRNKDTWEKVDQNWRSGIEYIWGNLQKILEDEGLVAYGKVGDKFDPKLHDSVEVVETHEKEDDDKLAEVMSSGYKFGQSILRPAKVKVYRFKN